jgi:hypothetical protein
VQILGSSFFTLQGYTFSNFRRTAGFSKLSGGTETATSRPFTSNSMVIGDAGDTTCTISVDFAGPTSGTIAAVIPGHIEAPPGTTVIHQFALYNTHASTAQAPRARLGLAFETGAFPGNFKIAVRAAGGSDVAFAAMAGSNTWTSDSSWRSTADGGLVMEDSNTIAAGASRTYEVYATAGTQATSGFNPWTWIAAHANDFTVALTSRTGSASGALGNLAFSLKVAIVTTTRREILCDTTRFVRVKVWEKLAGEEHLICEYHLDFWLDGSAVPVAVEFAPVLTQHWWIASPFGVNITKQQQTYTATVKYGTTTLDTRAALAHAYYCRWASLRSTADSQHARKHWIDLGSTAIPTMRVQYSDASLKAMMRAGYIPPLRLGNNYSPHSATTYTPLGANGHNTGIDSTGTSPARGVWGDPDARLVTLQGSATAATAETAWRAARVMAQAGLAVGYHWRDHRSASGVNGGTDTTNRLIPQTFRQASVLGLTQTYTGLSTHCVYTKRTFGTVTGLTTLVHAAPVGGTGAFTLSGDNSHAMTYCAPMAFLEGEAYLGDAAISQFNAGCSKNHFSEFGHDLGPMYAGTLRGTAQSIPNTAATRWGTLPDMSGQGQERSMAWGVNLTTFAYALRADSHPEQAFIANMVRNLDGYLTTSYNYLTTAHRAKGGAYIYLNAGGITSPWMLAFQGLAGYQAARVCSNLAVVNSRSMTGFGEMAHLSARLVVQTASGRPYAMNAYRTRWATDHGAAANMVPDDEYPMSCACVFAGNIGTVATSPVFGAGFTDGDKFRIALYNTNLATQTLPTGLSETTLYYLVSVSGTTFRLATTLGGAPITVGNGSVTVTISMQSLASITIIGSPYYAPAADGEMMHSSAVYELAIGNSHVDMTNGKRDAMRTAMATTLANTISNAAWCYNGDNLL